MSAKQAEPLLERSFELERLIFFSDAVFAIAITLLALELRVPELDIRSSEALLRAIGAQAPKFFAFGMSFWIISLFWLAHHRYFRYILRFDDGLARRNLVLLFFVVLVPFTTLVLGEYGNLPAAVWLYAVQMIALGSSGAWIWHYATSNHRLVSPGLDAQYIRFVRLRAFMTPLAATVTILLSFVLDGYGSVGFFLIFVFQRLLAYAYRGKFHST